MQASKNVFFENGKGLKKGVSVEKKCVDYYPFGMEAVSYTRTAADPTEYLYNGGVEKNDLTGYYETFYRSYDPSIGRFHQVDVMAAAFTSQTPYNYAFNDPVRLNDPLGDYPHDPSDPNNIGRYQGRDASGGMRAYGRFMSLPTISYGSSSSMADMYINGWVDRSSDYYAFGGSSGLAPIGWQDYANSYDGFTGRNQLVNVKTNLILLVGSYDIIIDMEAMEDGATLIKPVESLVAGADYLGELGATFDNLFLVTHGIVNADGSSGNGLKSNGGDIQYQDLRAFDVYGIKATETNSGYPQLGMNEVMSQELYNSIAALKAISSYINEGGTCMLAACRAGEGTEGDKFGRVLADDIFEGRVNVLLNSDYTSVNEGAAYQVKNFYDPNTGKRWQQKHRVPNNFYGVPLTNPANYKNGWKAFTPEGVENIGNIQLQNTDQFIYPYGN